MISTISAAASSNYGNFFHPKLSIASREISNIQVISCLKQSEFGRLSTQGSPDIDLHIQEIIKRQSHNDIDSFTQRRRRKKPEFPPSFLEESYEMCRQICAEKSSSFYLSSLLSTNERQKKAIWAIYAWGATLDEIVDGPNAKDVSPSDIDKWEERLDHSFNGNPSEIIDAALTDTVFNFPLDIKPFKDLIKGMQMDLEKSRYENFEELYEYCYYVAGTGALMTVPVLGVTFDRSSHSTQNMIYNGAISLAIGSQLTNILRDVTEDAMKGRIYLPQNELRQFGISDEDIFRKNVSDKWREFMKEQIARARYYFDIGEESISYYSNTSRWMVWASLMIYRKVLNLIEENDYDNLRKSIRVGKISKLLTLPIAFAKSQTSPPSPLII